MVFIQINRNELLAIAGQKGVYPGGSNKTDFKSFSSYVVNKMLTLCMTGDRINADDSYKFCYFRKTDVAKTAENGLLIQCSGNSCPFNYQSKSNVRDAPGYVYVLSNKRFVFR